MGAIRTRQELEALGNKIWNAARTELCLSFRFMEPALGSLSFQMDLSTKSVGTDAVHLLYNPNESFRMYMEDPAKLNRTYLHMLLHCIFRHMFAAVEYTEQELWDMCCDIAAEAVLDTDFGDAACIARISSDFRERCYETLRTQVKILTAERLYRYFEDMGDARDYALESRMAAEFHADDHSFWERMQKPEEPPKDKKELPIKDNMLPQHMVFKAAKEQWDKNAKRMKTDLETFGRERGDTYGSLDLVLKLSTEEKTHFAKYLEKFAVYREENHIDMNSFDYGLYQFGMDFYGNMPLIEENEYRETKKIQELVIAIDTSASCSVAQVQKFLRETAAILQNEESFFRKVQIHILECDDRVQRDVEITDLAQIGDYADTFVVKGRYGTDFRPVFEYIEGMQNKGILRNLKGLLYFTDGFGAYPEMATRYDTAFVFDRDRDHNDKDVPDWAMKLYM